MLILYHFIISFLLLSLFIIIFFFFFSSRRRHTRCSRDWSSDVCSSDLPPFKRRIALVLGNRQQLVWDLPPEETFLLNRAIYDIPAGDYRERLAELVTLLELGDVLQKPVRQLSLGERMKCELVASLLHRPPLLFLDEPTLGLEIGRAS